MRKGVLKYCHLHMAGYATCDLTATMIMSMKPAQDPGSQNSGTDSIDGLQFPALTEASQAADRC